MDPIIIASVAPFVAEFVKRTAATLARGGVTRETANGRVLHSPDQRLTVGVTKENGKNVPAIFIEKSDGRAKRQADNLVANTNAVVRELGVAHSSWPETKAPQSVEQEHFPGASVGHFQGAAGTLGCFVQATVRRSIRVGFLGASHVLALMNRGQRGDVVLRPGYPDGREILRRALVHLRIISF